MMDCENTPSFTEECVTVHTALFSHNHAGDLENGVTELFVSECERQPNSRETKHYCSD